MAEPTSPEPREVWLRDNARHGAVVSVALIWDFPAERLAEVEASWEPWRARHPEAEHSHWDWRRKADPEILRWLRLFAIEWEGIQGLMAVINQPRSSRLSPGARLVYVSVLEVAPWNLPSFTEVPLYSGCGTQLLALAVALSEESGWGGRIGLHSLPQAESFYEHCGLTRVGPDVEYGDLVYYELELGAAVRLRPRLGT